MKNLRSLFAVLGNGVALALWWNHASEYFVIHKSPTLDQFTLFFAVATLFVVSMLLVALRIERFRGHRLLPILTWCLRFVTVGALTVTLYFYFENPYHWRRSFSNEMYYLLPLLVEGVASLLIWIWASHKVRIVELWLVFSGNTVVMTIAAWVAMNDFLLPKDYTWNWLYPSIFGATLLNLIELRDSNERLKVFSRGFFVFTLPSVAAYIMQYEGGNFLTLATGVYEQLTLPTLLLLALTVGALCMLVRYWVQRKAQSPVLGFLSFAKEILIYKTTRTQLVAILAFLILAGGICYQQLQILDPETPAETAPMKKPSFLTPGLEAKKSSVSPPKVTPVSPETGTTTATFRISPTNDTAAPNARMVLGAAHNIFVGKVREIISTEIVDDIPHTRFNIKVLSNIKGELEGNVVVDQMGGYKDGKLYYVSGDIVVSGGANNGHLLQSGATYLLVTRGRQTDKWLELSPLTNVNLLIASDPRLGDSELTILAGGNAKVQEYIEDYPIEALDDEDVRTAETWNSFNSLPEQEKAEAKERAAKVDQLRTGSSRPTGVSSPPSPPYQCLPPHCIVEDAGKKNVEHLPEVEALRKKYGEERLFIKALDRHLIGHEAEWHTNHEAMKEHDELLYAVRPDWDPKVTGCVIVVYAGGEGYVYQEDKELKVIGTETLSEFYEKTKEAPKELMSRFYLSLH